MAQDFRKLVVWEHALKLASLVHGITKSFPKDEKYVLTQQTHKAAYSITLNITEGAGSDSPKDFQWFLTMAKRSAFEVIGCFEIAIELKYITRDIANPIIRESERVAKMISNFQKSIRDSQDEK
ncbi:MAG: four helix bundle protein [Planctomycetota bacterium]|jgi:four helix bundle protein